MPETNKNGGARIDALLKDCARHENARIPFQAHKQVLLQKARAQQQEQLAEEPLAFAPPTKKRATRRFIPRLAAGFAAAAAVLLVVWNVNGVAPGGTEPVLQEQEMAQAPQAFSAALSEMPPAPPVGARMEEAIPLKDTRTILAINAVRTAIAADEDEAADPVADSKDMAIVVKDFTATVQPLGEGEAETHTLEKGFVVTLASAPAVEYLVDSKNMAVLGTIVQE